jgi:hypothetical protein
MLFSVSVFIDADYSGFHQPNCQRTLSAKSTATKNTIAENEKQPQRIVAVCVSCVSDEAYNTLRPRGVNRWRQNILGAASLHRKRPFGLMLGHALMG